MSALTQRIPPPEHPGIVLIVDDEPLVLRAHALLLKRCPHMVVPCLTPHEAIRYIIEGNVRVVVSDVMMPELSGIDLLRMIRQHEPDLPVVLVTGQPAIGTAAEAVEFGAFRYLVKPVNPELFVTTVGRAARLHQLAQYKRKAIELFGEHSAEVSQLGLEIDFERALDELWIAFQPIVRADDRTIFGYEALLRSNQYANHAPEHVLRAAERLGALARLGRAVRQRAAESITGAHPALSLFVNLHPQDLLDPDLHDGQAALSSVANRVVLEITERASITDIEGARGRVSALRERGFRIAVDDLGAGYAGLNSFALLEPDYVKFDTTLIRDVDTSTVKQKLIKNLASLCNDMGLHVIAEGVETRAERDVLIELGCGLLQGNLLARPGPAFPEISWDRSNDSLFADGVGTRH